MRKQILEKDIHELEFDTALVKKFEQHNITQLKNIWILKRKDLKEIGLTDSEINQIVIKLQLHGFDLNKKKY